MSVFWSCNEDITLKLEYRKMFCSWSSVMLVPIHWKISKDKFYSKDKRRSFTMFQTKISLKITFLEKRRTL